MLRKHLIVGLMVVLAVGALSCSVGCNTTLDKDMLALTQEHVKAFDIVIQFSQVQRQIIQERINQTFDMAEKQIADRDAKVVLDPRTVIDDDGVARVMTKDKNGVVRAWSRKELDVYITATIAVRKVLMQKRLDWDAIDRKWGELLAKAQEVNGRQLKTMTDLAEAKKSAQALAEQATAVLSSLTAGLVSGYVMGL